MHLAHTEVIWQEQLKIKAVSSVSNPKQLLKNILTPLPFMKDDLHF